MAQTESCIQSAPTPSNHHQACREITQDIDLSHHPRWHRQQENRSSAAPA